MKATHAVVNFNPYRPSVRGPVALALVLSIAQTTQVCHAQVAAAKSDEAVSLRIASVLGAADTTLAFTVVNNTKIEISTRHFNSNSGNAVTLVTPSGKEIRINAEGDQSTFLIKPTESFTWKDSMQQVFGFISVKEPGLYKVIWRLFDIKDDKAVGVYTAEAFILREAPTKPGQ